VLYDRLGLPSRARNASPGPEARPTPYDTDTFFARDGSGHWKTNCSAPRCSQIRSQATSKYMHINMHLTALKGGADIASSSTTQQAIQQQHHLLSTLLTEKPPSISNPCQNPSNHALSTPPHHRHHRRRPRRPHPRQHPPKQQHPLHHLRSLIFDPHPGRLTRSAPVIRPTGTERSRALGRLHATLAPGIRRPEDRCAGWGGALGWEHDRQTA
jgi:hypothetical protein